MVCCINPAQEARYSARVRERGANSCRADNIETCSKMTSTAYPGLQVLCLLLVIKAKCSAGLLLRELRHCLCVCYALPAHTYKPWQRKCARQLPRCNLELPWRMPALLVLSFCSCWPWWCCACSRKASDLQHQIQQACSVRAVAADCFFNLHMALTRCCLCFAEPCPQISAGA
jgi:hypothetical protein